MSASRVDTSKLAAASGTTASVTRPTLAATGNLLLAAVGVETATAITPPAGWNEVFDEQVNSQTFRHGLYWRIDDGSAGPYSFAYGGSNVFRWWRAVAYTGHDPANPINDVDRQQSGSASATVTAPSLDTTVNDCLLAWFGNPDGSTTTTWTQPGGMTPVDTIANSVFYAEQAFPTAGSTGAKAATISAARHNVGAMVAIAPAPGQTVRRLGLLGVGQ